MLCDPGWKEIYDALLDSTSANVQEESINCRFPLDSGICEKIDRISQKHPNGFVCITPETDDNNLTGKSALGIIDEQDEHHDGTAAMDLAEHALKSYETLQRAKRKLKAVLIWMNFVMDRQGEQQLSEPKALQSAGNSMQENLKPILQDNLRSRMKTQQLTI